jgi:hypothetical protein
MTTIMDYLSQIYAPQQSAGNAANFYSYLPQYQQPNPFSSASAFSYKPLQVNPYLGNQYQASPYPGMLSSSWYNSPWQNNSWPGMFSQNHYNQNPNSLNPFSQYFQNQYQNPFYQNQYQNQSWDQLGLAQLLDQLYGPISGSPYMINPYTTWPFNTQPTGTGTQISDAELRAGDLNTVLAKGYSVVSTNPYAYLNLARNTVQYVVSNGAEKLTLEVVNGTNKIMSFSRTPLMIV